MPIMVGGNGRERTWRLAARYADELNLDSMAIEDMPEALEVIAQRCEEIDRDPATLRVSVHLWWEGVEFGPVAAGPARSLRRDRDRARDDPRATRGSRSRRGRGVAGDGSRCGLRGRAGGRVPAGGSGSRLIRRDALSRE